MSSVEVGDWMSAKANPSAFLEVIGTTTEGGVDYVMVRVGRTELQVSRRYLLACWQHLEDSAEERGHEGVAESAGGLVERGPADGSLVDVDGEQDPGDGGADEGVEGTVGDVLDGGHAPSMRGLGGQGRGERNG